MVTGQLVAARFEVKRVALGDLQIFEGNADHAFNAMIDARWLDRIVFYVQSTALVDVQAQVIGAEGDVGTGINAAVTIGASETVPAAGGTQSLTSVGVNINGGDWHPWLGLIIRTTLAPASGKITAWAWLRQIIVEQ